MNRPKSQAPEISLEIIGGADDGLYYCGNQSEILIGRENDKFPNDLSLGSSYCSRKHSRVFWEDGNWYVADRNSQNLTKIRKKELGGESESEKLESTDYFIVGAPVVEFREKPRRPAVPASNETPPASGAARKMLERAREAAARTLQTYISVENLFEVIATCEAPLVPEFFTVAKLKPEELVKQMQGFDPWTGPLEWIGEIVDARKSRSSIRSGSQDLLLTPRVKSVLYYARKAREETGASELEVIHLLTGILQEGGGIPNALLRKMGKDPDQLAGSASRLAKAHFQPEKTAAPVGKTEALVRPQPETPPPAKPPKPKRKPVDHNVWITACELLESLHKIQVQYHLADARARFESLRKQIRDTLGKLPPQKRGEVCEQMEAMLPFLIEGIKFSPPVDRVTGDVGTISDADADFRLEEAKSAAPSEESAPSMDTPDMLKDIFDTRSLGEVLGISRDKIDNNFLKLTKFLFLYVLRTEEFTKAMLATLGGGRTGESRIFLRSATQDLTSLIEKLMKEDNPETVSDINEYLNDLRHWQMALIRAYQEAFNQWNTLLWKRINPVTIEQESDDPRFFKKLGKSKGDYWETYKKIAQDLKPDITIDEFKQILDLLTNQNFEVLRRKEKKPE